MACYPEFFSKSIDLRFAPTEIGEKLEPGIDLAGSEDGFARFIVCRVGWLWLR